jgi:hypothetical protein
MPHNSTQHESQGCTAAATAVLAWWFTKLDSLFISPNWWRDKLPGRWMWLGRSGHIMELWSGFRPDFARLRTVKPAVFMLLVQDGNSAKHTIFDRADPRICFKRTEIALAGGIRGYLRNL